MRIQAHSPLRQGQGQRIGMETCHGHPHPGLAENVAGEPRQKYVGRRQLQVGLDCGTGRDISSGEKFSLAIVLPFRRKASSPVR